MRGRIHDITVHTPTGAAKNAEGYATTTFDSVTVFGRATPLTDVEAQAAAQRGYTSNVAAMVPLDTIVAPACEVTIGRTGALGLDGRYKVVEVGPTAQGQRLALRSFDTPEAPSSQVVG